MLRLAPKGDAPIEQPMLFAELDAAPDLRTWVDCYWHFRVAPEAEVLEHWVPPDGGLSLGYDPAEKHVGLSGPWLAPYKPPVYPDMAIWGIRFWPGAGQALLGIAPKAVRNHFLGASEVLSDGVFVDLMEALRGARDQESTARGFDRWLRDLAADSPTLDAAVMSAVFRLISSGGQERIGDIAEGVGLSPRQFRRRFQKLVGLSPKELARIRRFRSSAIEAVAGSESWVGLAVDHGYADQAHLVHEYQRLIGLTPGNFQRQFAKIRHRLKDP